MSKKTISKNKSEQQNDIDYKVVKPIVKSDNGKQKKNKTKLELKNKVEQLECENVDEKHVNVEVDILKKNIKETQKKRQTKNEIYKKDQERLFEELKTKIKLENGIFYSNTVNENNDFITGEILDGLKKYFDKKLSANINGKETKSSIAIIKKIFEVNGFDIVSKEYNNITKRGYIYYVVPIANPPK